MKSEMRLIGLLGATMLCVIFCVMTTIGPWQNALQWLLQASLLWCWVWREVWRRRDLNRLNTGSALLPHLGWANRLTLLRGYLIALTGGFLFQTQAENFIGLLPGLFYSTAAILDRVDGFVARKNQQTTLLGAQLDTVFDAFGLIVAPLVAIIYGKVHWSYLLLSFAYYIFQWALAVRKQRGLPVYDILPSQLRRTLAGFQMGFIAVALFPWFKAPPLLICSFAFSIPVLLGFAIDWLVVAGRINGKSTNTQKRFTLLTKYSTEFFQPVLRLFICAGLLYTVHQMHLSFALVYPHILFVMALLLGTSLLLIGWAGRVGALIILFALTSYPIAINSLTATILCSTVLLLLLGSGRFSLWQWDDVWVNRRDGA